MSSKKLEGARSRAASGTKSQATRGRILDAAHQLFNDEGTAAVSTNHIAAAAGLSPGNLYYHFADKKEIIRELHARYAAAHEDRWRQAPDAQVGLVALRQSVTEGAALAWRYRFFERERLALLRADPHLCADYREVYERRLVQWLDYAEQLVAHGLVRPPRPPGTLRRLGIAVWLIAENWLAFLDVVGDPQDPEQVAEGADLILVALEPHLTALGRRQWQASAPEPGKGGSSGMTGGSQAGEAGVADARHRLAGEE
ncbi:TetR/AcrR family transcriptional regulator [Streptomyces sp. YIM S03343]